MRTGGVRPQGPAALGTKPANWIAEGRFHACALGSFHVLLPSPPPPPPPAQSPSSRPMPGGPSRRPGAGRQTTRRLTFDPRSLLISWMASPSVLLCKTGCRSPASEVDNECSKVSAHSRCSTNGGFFIIRFRNGTLGRVVPGCRSLTQVLLDTTVPGLSRTPRPSPRAAPDPSCGRDGASSPRQTAGAQEAHPGAAAGSDCPDCFSGVQDTASKQPTSAERTQGTPSPDRAPPSTPYPPSPGSCAQAGGFLLRDRPAGMPRAPWGIKAPAPDPDAPLAPAGR